MSTTSCGVAASVYNLAAFLMGGMVLFLPYGFKCAGDNASNHAPPDRKNGNALC